MRRTRLLVALVVSVGLVLGACGGDADDGGAGDDATASGSGAVQASLSADGIDVPDEIKGGVVEVEFDSQVEEGELNFTRVKAGTTEDDFKQAISKTVAGGPVPDFVEATAGFFTTGKGTSTHALELEAGEYIVWAIPEGDEGEGEGEAEAEGGAPSTSAGSSAPAEGEGDGPGQGPPPEAVLTATTTVTAGGGGELPAGAGTITAKDYSFEIDIDASAGETFVFRNEGPDQLHHVILFNLGTIDPEVAEAKFPALLEAGEDGPRPPEFADLDMSSLDAGGSGVFTPGSGGTASAKFTPGNTYAAVCFIGDRSGGPPHAFAHNMRTIFKAE